MVRVAVGLKKKLMIGVVLKIAYNTELIKINLKIKIMKFIKVKDIFGKTILINLDLTLSLYAPRKDRTEISDSSSDKSFSVDIPIEKFEEAIEDLSGIKIKEVSA